MIRATESQRLLRLLPLRLERRQIVAEELHIVAADPSPPRSPHLRGLRVVEHDPQDARKLFVNARDERGLAAGCAPSTRRTSLSHVEAGTV